MGKNGKKLGHYLALPDRPKKVLFSAQRLRYSQSFSHVLCVLEQSNL